MLLIAEWTAQGWGNVVPATATMIHDIAVRADASVSRIFVAHKTPCALKLPTGLLRRR